MTLPNKRLAVPERTISQHRATPTGPAGVSSTPSSPPFSCAQRRHHAEALAHLDRALALAPSFGDALALKGGIKTYVGDPGDSINLLRRAMRLNPAAGYLYFLLLGRAYVFLDDGEQALINLREAISRNPANLEAHVYLAVTLESSGDRNGALWEAEEIRSIQPDFSHQTWLKTYPMTDPQQVGHLKSILARLDL